MKEPNDLSLAHLATNPAEAEIVRLLLEAEGLIVFIPNKNMPYPGVDVTPWDGEYTAAGCEVLVPRSDVGRAKEILSQARARGKIEAKKSEEEDEGGDVEDTDDTEEADEDYEDNDGMDEDGRG